MIINIRVSFYREIGFREIEHEYVLERIESERDEFTKCRQNGRWYTNKTIENIIQVAGRSVRSKTDEAVTYILDSSFSWCYNQYKEDYPKWFDEAIVKGGDL